MEFSLRVGVISFFVFCKFEIVIFKILQVMTENKPFAFLYVLSIFYFLWNSWIPCFNCLMDDLGLGSKILVFRE